jgi:nucleotide-binding universal stress UspA family protein
MKKPKRLLVALKTLDHAIELTDYACRLGAPGASVLLVHILELPQPTPLDVDVPDLDAAAEKILRTAERIVRRAGMKSARRLLRAHNAGPALLEEIKERKIEMAVLGYHHRRSLGEILLGTTAQHIARRAPCHILMSIPPRP